MPRKNPMLYFGTLLLFGFALTGMYLKGFVKPALGEDIAHRMMARANHLYLLFISLLIMTASQLGTAGRGAWIRRSMVLGKLLLCLSGSLLAVAVFTDHGGGTRDRVATFYGCLAALAGGLGLAAGVLDQGGLKQARPELRARAEGARAGSGPGPLQGGSGSGPIRLNGSDQ